MNKVESMSGLEIAELTGKAHKNVLADCRGLDDYVKLYEVLESNSAVKDILYAKYQPNRLTGEQK